MESGGVKPEALDAVFSSAGGYPNEDEEEARAIIELFGARNVPVVAIKALVGETLGAGGALNLAAAIAAMERGILPPMPHAAQCAFEELNLVRRPYESELKNVLVNSGSPGHGRWVCLLVSA